MISSLDLARLCAVSQGTVDRALHDRPGIGKATKEKILLTARKYGYLPHPAARELLTGERRQVGAIVPSVNSVFFMDLINAVRETLAESGFRFFISAVSNREEFLDVVADFSARRSKAIIMIPPERNILIPDRFVSDNTLLATLIDSCRGPNVHFVSPDEQQTGEQAVRFLLGHGHRRISHLTYTRASYAVSARARGYSLAMRKKGLPCSVIVPVNESSLMRAVRAYRPTALFCHNDWLALSAMKILQSNGIRIPEDMSILGVDNSPTFTELYPDITTMAYPSSEIARAVQDLLRGQEALNPIGPCQVIDRTTVRTL